MKTYLHCDVTIIGGGPAGLATALALRQYGLNVIVIEKSKYRDMRAGEHLTPNAVAYLKHLGVHNLVTNTKHAPCPSILSAWGSSDLVEKNYIFSPYGDGYNLSRPEFDTALKEVAEQRGATVLQGVRLNPPVRTSKGWLLESKQSQTRIQTRILADASGRSVWFSRAIDNKCIKYDKLIGIVACLDPGHQNASLDHRLLIEACENGWWYTTMLGDGRVIATYMTDYDTLPDRRASPFEYWKSCLASSIHTKTRLAGLELSGSVYTRPAHTQRVENTSNENWITVGDAAASYDPLSSAGMSKGLQWGMRSARAIKGFFDGDRNSFSEYKHETRVAFESYLQSWHRYYRMENRWQQSIFWHRRQTVDRSAVIPSQL